MAESSAQGSAVINRNYKHMNYVAIEDVKETINKTLDICIETLRSHCGPLSGYAMIVKNGSVGMEFDPAAFTRDGIGIIKALSFLSPLEQNIQNLLSYVGSRVDHSAKDGTTTSMLIAANFLKLVLNRDDTSNKILGHFTVPYVNEVFSRVIKLIDEELENYRFNISDITGKPFEECTEQELMNAAGKIAFMQTLSSSGGNIELARCMSEIYSLSPSTTWDRIEWGNSQSEDTPTFKVEVSEYDDRIRVAVSGQTQLNAGFGTELMANDADILIVPAEIPDQSGLEKAVCDFINSRVDNPKHLCIIAPRFSGGVFMTATAFIGNVSLFEYSDPDRLGGKAINWDLYILAARAGIEPILFGDIPDVLVVEPSHLFNAPRLHYANQYLHFYGTIPIEDDTCVHPMFAYPQSASKYFKYTQDVLNSQIKKYESDAVADPALYSEFRTLLNRLTTVHRPMLRIGGLVHEQRANQSVVQDVQGAIMASLKHGFYINGVGSLLSACVNAQDQRDSETDHFLPALIEAVALTEQSVIGSLFRDSNDLSFAYDAPCDKYNNNLFAPKLDPEGWMSFDSYLEIMNRAENPDTKEIADDYILEKAYPILQPANMYTELFKRLKELHLKFMLTNKIMIMGGVAIPDTE